MHARSGTQTVYAIRGPNIDHMQTILNTIASPHFLRLPFLPTLLRGDDAAAASPDRASESDIIFTLDISSADLQQVDRSISVGIVWATLVVVRVAVARGF